MLVDTEQWRTMPSDQRVPDAIRKLSEAGFTDDQIKEKLVRDSGLAINEAGDILEEYKQQVGKKILAFWDVDDKGKVTIIRNKFANFLKDGGFSLYFYDSNSTIFKLVRNNNGFLEEVSTEKIKKYVVEYIKSLEPLEPFDHGTTSDALLEIMHRGASVYFSVAWLEFLEAGRFYFL